MRNSSVPYDELTQAFNWLQSLRPLSADVVEELRHRYEVSLTHHSTAIEGNTHTQIETQIVIEKGVTIGGKSLAENLEIRELMEEFVGLLNQPLSVHPVALATEAHLRVCNHSSVS